MEPLLPRISHISAYTAHQGGLVLWYSTGSLARLNMWDTAGYKRVSHAFEGMCVQETGDDAFASRN